MDDGREAATDFPAPRQAPRRPRAPWGFLGMFALVMAVEATLAGHDLDFTEVWHWDWRVFGKTVAAKAKGRDVLFFGDSMVKFGMMPKVIREHSKLSAFNFALHSGHTSSSYFMFRRALEGGARPKAVVLDLTPHLFRQSPVLNDNLWGELLRPGEALDLAWTMGRDADFLARTLVSGYLTSYRERHEIRKNVVAALRGESSSSRGVIAQFRRNWKVNDGAQLMGDNPPQVIDVDHWVGHLYPLWSTHPANVAYLDRFLALARSRDIPVFWYLPPVHPGIQARVEATGFDADYTRFVRETRARFPEVTVIDARKAGLAGDLFSDGAHPNRRGALLLSAALGDLLRDREATRAKGWVALDPSASRPFDRPIEDVWQSSIRVQNAAKRTIRR